jgi:hypothetical protein
MITILDADCNNLCDFLSSLRLSANQGDRMSLLTKKRSRYLLANQADLLNCTAWDDMRWHRATFISIKAKGLSVEVVTESPSDGAGRMSLYHQMVMALPHHTHLILNREEGDCYGLLLRILELLPASTREPSSSTFTTPYLGEAIHAHRSQPSMAPCSNSANLSVGAEMCSL